MSYYKTIDGEKYEKSLLDLANELSKGRGDGRISEDDLKQLTKAVLDGAEITAIERKTLKYILKNFQFTEKAKNWYWEYTPVIADDRRFRSRMYRLLDDYRIDYTELKIDPRVVENMNQTLASRISFFKALQLAVELFLSDNNRNSPLYEVDNIVSEYLGISPNDLKEVTKWPGVVLGLLKERINEGYIELLPVWEDMTEEERGDLQIPDIDVSAKDSWIFYLGIRTDDHQFFAIVDRQGEKAPYIYGYN